MFATDALLEAAYQWIRSIDKLFVADKEPRRLSDNRDRSEGMLV
ncbi:MAG: hypothetical protein Q9M09_05120 [Mariprofundaceae bacterium]|nr:hypothetical protein [Mariprofundaceae bacterium]